MVTRKMKLWGAGGAAAVVALAVAAGVLFSSDRSSGPPLKAVRGVAAAPWDGKSPQDLLNFLDTKKDVVGGEWGFDGRVLVSHQSSYGRIMIPCAPPEEYDLRVVALRKIGGGSLTLGLVLGGRQAAVLVDGWEDGAVCGLDMLDEKLGNGNETTYRGSLLPREKSVTLLCSVRKDRLTVSADGKKVIDWPAGYDRVSLWHAWTVPSKKALFLGSFDTLFRIDEVTLTPVSGIATLLR